MLGFDEDATLSFETGREQLIRVAAGAVERDGIFFLPENAHGLVILAQGIEDASHRPHQRALALTESVHSQRLATFVVDIFSSEEQELDRQTAYFRQNTDIMQQRLIGIADWFQENPTTETLSIGYFGIDEAGAAALIAWVLNNPAVTAAIVGARSVVQIEEMIPASEFRLKESEIEPIQKFLEENP